MKRKETKECATVQFRITSFHFFVQKLKDYSMYRTYCFAWTWKMVSHIRGEGRLRMS